MTGTYNGKTIVFFSFPHFLWSGYHDTESAGPSLLVLQRVFYENRQHQISSNGLYQSRLSTTVFRGILGKAEGESSRVVGEGTILTLESPGIFSSGPFLLFLLACVSALCPLGLLPVGGDCISECF